MKKKKIPSIKKDITSFISSEEGKISKKSIIDLGLGLIALSIIVGAISPPKNYDVEAISSHVSHSNHSSHSSHSSY